MQLAEYESLLSDVETKLDRLKVLYEQWFQGMERLEPAIPRKDIDRRFVVLRKELPRNTALRFRFQMLVQRYTTLQTYWQRVGRQIEEGTYRRDLLRTRQARLEARKLFKGERPAYELDLDVEVDAIEDAVEPSVLPTRPSLPSAPLPPPPLAPVAPTAPRPISPFARRGAGPSVAAPVTASASEGPPTASLTAPTTTFSRPKDPTPAGTPVPPREAVRSLPPPVRVSAPPAAAEPTSNLPTATFARPAPTTTFSRPKDAAPAPPARPAASADADVRGLYERYVEARRKNNEPGVAYEAMARSIKEMRERLRDKYGGKSVDFEVVVRDGKVGLKPVPK